MTQKKIRYYLCTLKYNMRIYLEYTPIYNTGIELLISQATDNYWQFRITK